MNWEAIALLATLLGVLVTTTFKLGGILQRFVSLEKKLEATLQDAPTLRQDLDFIKSAIGVMSTTQAKHGSYITELRIKTGILDESRRSQGDFR